MLCKQLRCRGLLILRRLPVNIPARTGVLPGFQGVLPPVLSWGCPEAMNLQFEVSGQIPREKQ
jgi:hypothetical protein